MRVLIACEMSGTVRRAFATWGHYATSCDIVPTLLPCWPSETHVQDDVRALLALPWDLIIAHPPCTYLTYGGPMNMPSRIEAHRIRLRDKAARFADEIWNAPCPRVCVENPVGHLNSIWRGRPSQVVQPWWFGDREQKRTVLWLKGLPPLTPTEIVAHDGIEHKNRTRKVDPGTRNDKRIARSIFFAGIANAMAEQWGGD